MLTVEGQQDSRIVVSTRSSQTKRKSAPLGSALLFLRFFSPFSSSFHLLVTCRLLEYSYVYILMHLGFN